MDRRRYPKGSLGALIGLEPYRVDGDDLDSMVGGCCMGMVQEHVSLKFHPITSLSSSQKAFVGISKVAFWNRWSCGHCRRLFPPETLSKEYCIFTGKDLSKYCCIY
jgi:hypothetical protein